MNNALAIRAKLRNWSDLDPPQEITNRVRGAVTGTLNRKCGGDAQRRLVLSWLFSPLGGLEPISSKELSDKQIGALVRWIDWYKDPDINEWLTGADFDREILVVLTATLLAYSKSPLAVKDEYDIDPASPLLLGVELGGEITCMTDTFATDTAGFFGEEEPQPDRHGIAIPHGSTLPHRPGRRDYCDILEGF